MIDIQNLSKYYHQVCAVDHINIQIANGEIVGLLGPNGAGKTTTLRILTGYIRSSSGTIKVKDWDLDSELLNIKSIIGYLPESAPIYPNLLTYDFLCYSGKVRNLSAKDLQSKIKEVGQTCGLYQVMHKPVAELSKGFKQRLGLANALLHDPEILILDEPTSGLDPNQILEIRNLIRKIGQEKTVILSTHILREAEATCDRMIIINQGQIVADGSPQDLKAKDTGVKLKLALKGASPEEVKDKLQGIQEILSIRQQTAKVNESASLLLDCQPETDPREKIYKLIKETDWTLMEFSTSAKDLETIFKQLTQEN